jgi:hypothetical protein
MWGQIERVRIGEAGAAAMGVPQRRDVASTQQPAVLFLLLEAERAGQGARGRIALVQHQQVALAEARFVVADQRPQGLGVVRRLEPHEPLRPATGELLDQRSLPDGERLRPRCRLFVEHQRAQVGQQRLRAGSLIAPVVAHREPGRIARTRSGR